MKAIGESLFRPQKSSPLFAWTQTKMLSHNAEETLHIYLRRHFEKMSRKRAGQFTERAEAPDVDFVVDTPPVEVSRS